MLKIALPNKGALADGAAELVRESGYACKRAGRELSIYDKANDVTFVFLRPRDISSYVSCGAIDLGITGRDLNEDSGSPAKELLPLAFGHSTFRYAVPKESDLVPDAFAGLRIATSYPTLVRRDLEKRGIAATTVRLDGAVEISVSLGLADAIGDVVDSGRTIDAMGLKIVGEPILASEAVIVGKAGLRHDERPEIRRFIRRMEGVVMARGFNMIEYDIPKALLEKAVVITPGVAAPTVAPLSDAAWVAVKALIKKGDANNKIDELADLGAKGIVVTDIRTCRM